MKYLILILLLIPTTSHAKDYYFNISTSSIYTNINEPNYEYINEYEQIKNPLKDSLKSLSIGISGEFKDYWTINLTTSRFYSKEISRSVRQKSTGVTLTSRSRIIADTFQIGKRYKRLLPMIFISNIEVDKSLWHDSQGFLGREIKHTILWGLNLNYYLTKNISSSLFYIMPNREMNLASGFGFGINYNF